MKSIFLLPARLKALIVLSFIIATTGAMVSAQSGHTVAPDAGGAFEFPEQQSNCSFNEKSDEMHEEFLRNRRELVQRGILKPKEELSQTRMTTLFEWPLRQADGFTQNSYYAVQNYVDLDPTSGIQDYNCGNRTYNGHKGLDVLNWPYWWHMMEDDQVEVIAAAPGVIVAKFDGNFDQNCSCTGNWNAVYVEHADGSIVFYGHLKTGTLTSKGIGASVAIGEYIGVVGSSGCSTYPHLHFEIRDVNLDVIDPYSGSCNTGTSWWANQKPYREPTLNALMTHDVGPVCGYWCPGLDQPNISNNFEPGDAVNCAIYLQDQLSTSSVSFSIEDPVGTITHSWNYSFSAEYSFAWWYWTPVIPMSAVEGVYTLSATFEGQTVEHNFMVGCASNIALNNETVTHDVTYSASQNITTSGDTKIQTTGGGAAKFTAGNSVTLGGGFEVNEGSDFIIEPGPCP